MWTTPGADLTVVLCSFLSLNVYTVLMHPTAHSASSFHRERSCKIVRRQRLCMWRATYGRHARFVCT